MRTVNAPEGYEGCVYYEDAGRCWQPGFRKVGATWWTLTRSCGHAHLPKEEITQRAEALIRDAIAIQQEVAR